MVKNTNIVWEPCGLKIIKKYIPEVNMVKEDLRAECWRKNQREIEKTVWDDDLGKMIKKTVINEDYAPYTPRIKYAQEKWDEYYKEWDWNDWPKGPKWDKMYNRWLKVWATEEAIFEYLGKVPFVPSIFMTISPNWKCKSKSFINDKHKAQFKNGIEKYLNACNRYDDWSYIIEAGSDGNHLHAHLVAHINKDIKNSVLGGKNSHIRKGKHISDIKKCIESGFDNWGGIGGIWGVNSVTSSICNSQEIVDDKLAYLVEDLKPEDHKNKMVIDEVRRKS